MREAPATLAHAEYILDHISEQNKAEHQAMGLTRWGALKKVSDFMRIGETTTAFIEDRPVCMLGVFEDLGQNTTWFLATKEYFSLGMPAVIHARRFLKKLKRRPLITGTCSPHPEVDRWFKLLGYKKIGEEDGVKWFVFGDDTASNLC